jgi:hypothetical protein
VLGGFHTRLSGDQISYRIAHVASPKGGKLDLPIGLSKTGDARGGVDVALPCKIATYGSYKITQRLYGDKITGQRFADTGADKLVRYLLTQHPQEPALAAVVGADEEVDRGDRSQGCEWVALVVDVVLVVVAFGKRDL